MSYKAHFFPFLHLAVWYFPLTPYLAAFTTPATPTLYRYVILKVPPTAISPCNTSSTTPHAPEVPNRFAQPYKFVQHCFYIVSIWYAWHLRTGCRRTQVDSISILTPPLNLTCCTSNVYTSINSSQLHVCSECHAPLHHRSLCSRTTPCHVCTMTSIHRPPAPPPLFPLTASSPHSYSLNIQLDAPLISCSLIRCS